MEKNKAAQELGRLSHKKQFSGKTKQEINKEMRRRSLFNVARLKALKAKKNEEK